MTLPDWQLPPGVDRGLWDYLQATDMVARYDEQMQTSPLARADVALCERVFAPPGRLVDLGCGTGRLAISFAQKSFDVTGVDLSAAMLARAAQNAAAAGVSVRWVSANLVDLEPLPTGEFDYAACLFSTLGMIRGAPERAAAVRAMRRVLTPRGRLVLHAHNRFFPGLGARRVCGQLIQTLLRHPRAGEVTMPQSYAGAPLTLHHFTRQELTRLLRDAGFRIQSVMTLSTTKTSPTRRGLLPYGFLIVAESV